MSPVSIVSRENDLSLVKPLHQHRQQTAQDLCACLVASSLSRTSFLTTMTIDRFVANDLDRTKGHKAIDHKASDHLESR